MNPEIQQWALRHNIQPKALAELRAVFLAGEVLPELQALDSTQSEAAVQQQVRLSASHAGARLWRNNVGAFKDDKGNFVRYGLANESARMNQVIKSSDLIGIRPVTVTPDMVGSVIGQFTAREVKKGNWKWRGSGREVAQRKFMEIVNALGGDAKFTTGEEKWT